MVLFPRSKINLGLTITGKRPDGYHDIETVFYPVPFCDALEMVVSTDGAKHDSLTVTGLNIPGPWEDNLILKAVKRLRESFSFAPLKIHLHKAIPTGAGLGGGSSDAACILCTINKYFGLSVETEELKILAAGMGSDCPFFIEGRPVYATGRGEIMKPVDNLLEGYKILLLNPGIQISTREAYESCIPGQSCLHLDEIITKSVPEWKDLMINDFEKTIFARFPLIGKLKARLYQSGALYSSMSGSGSTVYGIYRDEPKIPDDLKQYVIFLGEL